MADKWLFNYSNCTSRESIAFDRADRFNHTATKYRPGQLFLLCKSNLSYFLTAFGCSLIHKRHIKSEDKKSGAAKMGSIVTGII